jgi:WD40 repeat protein
MNLMMVMRHLFCFYSLTANLSILFFSFITSLEFNPAGDTICVCTSIHGGSAGEVLLISPMDGTTIKSFQDTPGVLACSYQPVGVYGIPPLLATCGHSGMMQLFNADTLDDRSDLLRTGHDVHCTTCAFSPNGMFFVSGDCQGNVLLRLFCMSKNQLTLVQKMRWEMSGPISGCVFMDAGHGRQVHLGYTYVDSEIDPPVKKSCFKTMLQPTFPDHSWWSSIVNEAGGAIIGAVNHGAHGLVVEDESQNKICTMDLMSTAPAPSEMPQKGADCGLWIKATPHLIHRQGTHKHSTIATVVLLYSFNICCSLILQNIQSTVDLTTLYCFLVFLFCLTFVRLIVVCCLFFLFCLFTYFIFILTIRRSIKLRENNIAYVMRINKS